MGSLASPQRLAVLAQLREPRALHEIVVRVPSGNRERSLTRQTVRTHLAKLLDAGLVRELRRAGRDNARVSYVVNHKALFALSEDVRALARIRPIPELQDATQDLPPPGTGAAPGAARALVMVKGLEEGDSYPLQGPPRTVWTIGRRRGSTICLDFDPFVSGRHATLEQQGAGVVLRDMGSSRNGTWINFRRADPRTGYPLEHGDILRIGRTLLVYRSRPSAERTRTS